MATNNDTQELFVGVQIPLQHTRLDHLMQATKGTWLRGETKPHSPEFVREILSQLKEVRQDMRTTMEHVMDPAKSVAVRTVYTNERDSLTALDLHLEAGAKQPPKIGGTRQEACALLYKVLFTDQEGYGRKDAVGMHDAAEQRLSLIDKRYLDKVAVAEAESLVNGLRTAHAETDAVLHLQVAPESPAVQKKRAKLIETTKRTMLRLNMWFDLRPEEREDALEVMQPIVDLMAWAKENRNQKSPSDTSNSGPGNEAPANGSPPAGNGPPADTPPANGAAPVGDGPTVNEAPNSTGSSSKTEAKIPSVEEASKPSMTKKLQKEEGEEDRGYGMSAVSDASLPSTTLAQAFTEGPPSDVASASEKKKAANSS